MQRHSGQRACYFSCDDAEAAQNLIDWLEENGIVWQDNSEIELEEWKRQEEERYRHGQ
ncbi:MAG: hypothetical protein WC375_04320 [Methanomassiliicoccales archaeon]